MITYPPCKINLGLHITEKRPDGFHNLESVFYPVLWTDILEIVPVVEKQSSGNVIFTASGIPVDGDSQNNLCVKAYQLLNKDFQLPAVKMHLHKNIPMGAGLGGGSSDAAFTLRMLNDMFQLGLSPDGIMNYARKLGSDCAFFVQSFPTYNWGKGDEFERLELDLSDYHIVIVHPGVHVSTKEAYSGVVPVKSDKYLPDLIKLPPKEWKNNVRNDFEKSIFPQHPEIARLKEKMYDFGAVYASMSGSGSSVFGIFEKKIETDGIFEGVVWQGNL